jgi:DNA (cytosine-5)-methyltransferase 1
VSGRPGKLTRVTVGPLSETSGDEAVQPFTFADLFAGVGGFHAALHALGGQPWFASEIDLMAQRVYEHNWQVVPHGDIVPLTEDTVMEVPPVDVLAGGFPCQAFSKSGFQRGMEETRGTLFWNIARVLEVHPPAVILLENVRNLVGPNHRDSTYDTIIETLRDLGYRVSAEPAILSPHLLPESHGGRPQVRERVFITGTYVGVGHARKPEHLAVEPVAVNKPPVPGFDPQKWTLDGILQDDDEIEGGVGKYRLSDDDVAAIDTWDKFVKDVLKGKPLPGFPVWADELRSPAVIPDGTPKWKETFLLRNAELYAANAPAIDEWRGGPSPDDAPNLAHLNNSRRKLEWQAGANPKPAHRTMWKTLMHFRPSGIRAKRPSYVPALVAITQTSIVGWRKRRITPREAARLQGLPDWWEFAWPSGDPDKPAIRQPDAASYKQMGNGVNVGAAYWVLRAHVKRDKDVLRKMGKDYLVDAVLGAPDNPDERLAIKPERVEVLAGSEVVPEAGGKAPVLQRGRGRTVRDGVRDVDLLPR